jgi:hypothetical protein
MPICRQCGRGFDLVADADASCPKCGAAWKAEAVDAPAPFTPGTPDQAALGFLLLTFGQVASIVSCVGAVIVPVVGFMRRSPGEVFGEGELLSILGFACAFLYSAAMAVLFSRVRQLPPLK